MLGEPQHVRAPLTKRGEDQGHDRQAVIEILAKSAGTYGASQVRVTGGDDPGIHGLGTGGAEPADLAVLEDLQELRLEAFGQQRDLVQEERAAVRRLEQPCLGLAGVRERPALEAE